MSLEASSRIRGQSSDAAGGPLVIVAGAPGRAWEVLAGRIDCRPLSDEFIKACQPLVNDGAMQDVSSSRQVAAAELDTEERARIRGRLSTEALAGGVVADRANVLLLEYWADSHPDTGFLMFCPPPEWEVAVAAEAGHNPRDRLAHWSECATILLSFYRRHRRRSLLLDPIAGASDPGGLAEACRSLGVTIRIEDLSGEFPDPGPAALYIAAGMVEKDEALRRLKLEVEASTYPIGKPLELPSATDALHGVLRGEQAPEERPMPVGPGPTPYALSIRERRGGDARIDMSGLSPEQLERENQLLREQVLRLQSELDRASPRAGSAGSHRQQETLPQPSERKPEREGDAHVSRGLFARYARRRRIRSHLRLIRRSGLLDESWYLKRYADVADSGMDPMLHYLLHGGLELRDPSPDFNTRKFLSTPDGRQCGNENPLVHYLKTRKS